MKYRSRTGKNLSDSSLLKDISNSPKGIFNNDSSSIRNYFSFLFQYFIGAMALISRSFLRRNLGERTVGFLSLFSITFFVSAVILFPSAYDATYSALFGTQDKDTLNKIITFFLTFIYPLVVLIIGNFVYSSSFNAQDFIKQITLDYSTELMLFISAALIIIVVHLIDILLRRRRKIVIHSFYRGDSLLFGWMEDKLFFGQRITKIGIWMLIEPLFVLCIAMIINDLLDIKDVVHILYFSSICLFIEEFRVYQENRRFELDLLDGQLDAAFAAELQKNYQESVKKSTEKETNSFKANLIENTSESISSEGSNSNFRAKIL